MKKFMSSFKNQFMMMSVVISAVFETSGVALSWSIPRQVSEVTLPEDYPPNVPFHRVIPLAEISDSAATLFFGIRKVNIHPKGKRLKTQPPPASIDQNTGYLWLSQKIAELSNDTQGYQRKNLTITVTVTVEANSTERRILRTAVIVLFTGNMSTFCEPGYEKCFPEFDNFYKMLESSRPGSTFDNLLQESVKRFCSHMSFSYSLLAENSKISISQDTGDIFLENELDAELSKYEMLLVSCSLKWDDESFEFNSTLHFNIIDVNDNSPTTQFGDIYGSYNFTMSANQEYLVFPLSVVDPDSKKVNKLQVRIVNDSLNLFAVKNTLLFWHNGDKNFTFFHAYIHSQKSIKFTNSSYKFFVVFEDTSLDSLPSLKNNQVVYEIDIVNSSYSSLEIGPVVTAEEYQSINVSINAALFARIVRLTPLDIMDNDIHFQIVPNGAENWLGLTEKSGILYIQNLSFLEKFQPGDSTEVNISWSNSDRNGSLSLNLYFNGEGIADSQCGRQKWCSVFEDEYQCTKSCGIGAADGQCRWHNDFPQSPSSRYATCSPDLLTCPDGQCDELEQTQASICPQDCASSIAGEAIPNRSGRGIEGAIGPCSCPTTDSCICLHHYPGLLSNSSESLFLNFTLSSEPYSDKQKYDSTEISSTTEANGTRIEESICGANCIFFVIFGVTLLILFPVLVCFIGRKRNHKCVASHISLSAVHYGYMGGRSSPSMPDGRSLENGGTGFVIEPKWDIPREHLRFQEVLGEGEFGKVLKAEAWDINEKKVFTTVAVKMLKGDVCSKDEQDFISEFLLLTEVCHPNIIRLLGACAERDGPFYIVVEYAELGSLRNYLRESYLQPRSEDGEGFAARATITRTCKVDNELLSYAWQISKGMSYLSDMKLVHRDLAARNVLLTQKKIAKISDFGLSRDVYEGDTYLKKSKGRVPVKWMAMESLEDNVYTTRSDVWSFGVVLWEIMSLGATPYPGISPERLYHLLKAGYRMEKPINCSEKSYDIMLSCWRESPFDRPSFKYLTQKLDSLLKDSAPYLDLEAGPSHVRRRTTETPERHRQQLETVCEEVPGINYTSLFLEDDPDSESLSLGPHTSILETHQTQIKEEILQSENSDETLEEEFTTVSS